MMALYWRKKQKVNAAEVLSWRERGIGDGGTLTRLNTKVLRAILLGDNRNFCVAWGNTSKSAILYENGKIYLENYLECFSCVHSKPHALYELPKRSKKEKFQDTLLCQSPLETTLASPSDQKPSLLCLTANNWLYRLADSTGQELERVFLSSKHKFGYINWDVSQEIFYVKSILNKSTSLQQQAGTAQNAVMHLAIFQIFPLQIVAMMEINKQVFGNGITDVDLSQGVLAVSYSKKALKLFSFEHILKKYLVEKITLGKPSSLLNGKTVGDVPFGIPTNIHITDCPPVLFEVSCSSNGVQFGGFPWHYIHTPPKKYHQGTHHFRSLKDSTLAINGIQNMDCCALESDVIFFHPDESGRIIHMGPSTINVLKILGERNSELPSKVIEDFSIVTQRNEIPSSQVTVTSSGRTVKRRFQQLDDDCFYETFRTVIYEDELDLLAVVVTSSSQEREGHVRIQLHDNHSGQLLKTVELLEPWDETFRHDLIFDKDTIAHIVHRNSDVGCYLYKLKTDTRSFPK
ncbi:DDB1- and CUL4-associated factor 17 [Syngnathus acus]|uniref:DDB1- and CUL4-associated factor 17 n=1 Tax=Syngnathus acus TaxID=161584 RepID=UPI001885EF8F|nr:DDB1- and CUL4-associated factor 17 [Syngnathus acus]XP_037096350.1 DDB1- and CUL4-associated factor 17 [Syngnathus acus]XP_037096352.1 DDB1- and CUL4-associated factor 17 [Syngnathus acus]